MSETKSMSKFTNPLFQDGVAYERERIIELIKASEFICTGHWAKDCPDKIRCEFTKTDWQREHATYHGHICDADYNDGIPYPYESCVALLALIKGENNG